jgi:hypothetical protein
LFIWHFGGIFIGRFKILLLLYNNNNIFMIGPTI